MNTVCEKDKCTGCMACVVTCEKKAISIIDSLKAYNAQIDGSKCIHCGACYEICQVNSEVELFEPIVWKQGWATDIEDRMFASSGGVATAIEKSFIRNGGIVCSCHNERGQFTFNFALDESDIRKFAGSKYVKSNPLPAYKRILGYLREGKKVLFVGLPCQVAAAKKFVRLEEKNLYTVDLICHGTPSPKLLDRFLEDHAIKKMDSDISFRNKSSYQVSVDGKTVSPAGTRDNYTIGFLNGLFYTENCYQCQYARKQRVSDITLGDSWGSALPFQEIEKGISLIAIQSEKGYSLITESNIYLTDVDVKNAINSNEQLRKPSCKPKGYERFYKLIDAGKSLDYSVASCLPRIVIKQYVKGRIILIKNRVKRNPS